MSLTTFEKWFALDALSPVSVKIRSPDDFYVDQDVSISGGNLITTIIMCGEGRTPEEAIEHHWVIHVQDLQSNRYLLTGDGRRVRWNGFMWNDVPQHLIVKETIAT